MLPRLFDKRPRRAAPPHAPTMDCRRSPARAPSQPGFGPERRRRVVVEIGHHSRVSGCFPRCGALVVAGLARPSTRRSTTSASDTDDRKTWICRPSSSHRSCVMQRDVVPVQPLALPGLAAGGADRLVDRKDDVGDAQFAGGPAQAIAAARARARSSTRPPLRSFANSCSR